MSILTEIIFFLTSLTFSALFAFLETAFTALRLFKLKELQLSVAKYKSLFASWEKNPQRILITILIANNFAHVLTSVLISEIMQHLFGNIGLAFGVALATIMILIFGEIIPKSFAKTHHERLFASFLWLINILYHLFYPVVSFLLHIADAVCSRIGGPHILEKHDDVSEKEIEFLIDYSDEKGLMETEKTEMLQNIFSLGQTHVKEIMSPKTEIIALSTRATFEEAIKEFNQSHHSRLPVYDGSEDNIVGIVHQKDVFEILLKNQSIDLIKLVRPVLFVPESQKINQLLSEFLKKRMHMAIVIDEYGSVAGLVTLEDIVEEIIGDITDEHEVVDASIVPLEKGGWLIDGGTDLEDLEDEFSITFNAEDSVTLAGWLTESLQHLPRKGERVFYEGFCFQVQQASPKRVLQVLVFESKDDLDNHTDEE